ncbi:ester cyclase [Desertivirga arenae]|uniref:ester cyclase n=1 Tax=Desertivirga arenae TaxID=2810309 RepID=UPI001A970486|nr:ester cyclase [Pedobacter sp. SYSU D00823]
MEDNKAIVRRFNQEVIASWNEDSFNVLMNENFVNHSAPEGMDNGPQGMRYFFNEILRPAISDIKVTVHKQLAEGDWVTTRKTISGTHTGPLLNIPATGRLVSINVIDIVRLKDGKYLEHWGLTTLPELLAGLSTI